MRDGMEVEWSVSIEGDNRAIFNAIRSIEPDPERSGEWSPGPMLERYLATRTYEDEDDTYSGVSCSIEVRNAESLAALLAVIKDTDFIEHFMVTARVDSGDGVKVGTSIYSSGHGREGGATAHIHVNTEKYSRRLDEAAVAAMRILDRALNSGAATSRDDAEEDQE